MYLDAQFCDGIADNFTDQGDIGGAEDENLVQLPLYPPYFLFREWIFPNNLKFPCNGLLTGWIFRARNINFVPNNLPLWVVYYKTTGTNQLSFTLREGSGSINEMTEITDGVYQYSLQSPVQVEEGDVVGIQYEKFPLTRTAPLQLTFIDAGSGVDGPVSYRRYSSGTQFLVGNNAEDLESAVSTETRFTPLLTAVMSKFLAGYNIKYREALLTTSFI